MFNIWITSKTVSLYTDKSVNPCVPLPIYTCTFETTYGTHIK